MHMYQQNHWNMVLFYWYQSYHWYQWTISLTNRIRLCILDMCGILGNITKHGGVYWKHTWTRGFSIGLQIRVY